MVLVRRRPCLLSSSTSRGRCSNPSSALGCPDGGVAGAPMCTGHSRRTVSTLIAGPSAFEMPAPNVRPVIATTPDTTDVANRENRLIRRRVVTGLTHSGRSTVVKDGAAPRKVSPANVKCDISRIDVFAPRRRLGTGWWPASTRSPTSGSGTPTLPACFPIVSVTSTQSRRWFMCLRGCVRGRAANGRAGGLLRDSLVTVVAPSAIPIGLLCLTVDLSDTPILTLGSDPRRV
jgi:hypothetical protein